MRTLAPGGGRLPDDPTRGPGAPGRSAQGGDTLAPGVPNGHSCIPARAVSARTLPLGFRPPNKGGGAGWGVGAERRSSRQIVLSLPGAGKRASPLPCTPGSARQLAGERRAGGAAAAAHGSGRVTISAPADLPWRGRRRQHLRGTLCAISPDPSRESNAPKGEVHNAIGLAYKVLGCRASFGEGAQRSCSGWPAGQRSSPGTGRRPASETLLASRGPARMERGALPRTGDSGAGTGRVRRCLFYPRLGEDSNKSCSNHFITLPARADSQGAEPGADRVSPSLALSFARPAPPQEFARP